MPRPPMVTHRASLIAASDTLVGGHTTGKVPRPGDQLHWHRAIGRNSESAMDTDLVSRPNYVIRALDLFAGYGEREALVRRDRRFTYAELRAAIMNMAVNMHEHGVLPGMAVAVLVERPLEAPILQLALHVLGVRSVWIDLDGLRRDLGEYLRLVRPELLVYDARTQDRLGRELAASLDIPVLCLGPSGLGPDVLRPNDKPFDPGW